MRDIVFVGNARCYHTMDWYRSVRKLCPGRVVVFATDLIDSEGHKVLVTADDDIIPLFNIDRILFRRQSRFGDIWRNLVKLVFSPFQVLRLRRLARARENAVYQAHTMYYMFLCWWARVPFVGTPQGSEILVRPARSFFYRFFAVRALRAARAVTVDSVAMQSRIRCLSGVTAHVVQNGVDVGALLKAAQPPKYRSVLLSIRGMTPLYRIHEILSARAHCCPARGLVFIYPFWDENYLASLKCGLIDEDRVLGRLDRQQMLELLSSTMLTLSIPSSDSSPRSVYEAIFAGSAVAASPSAWIDGLTDCMRARVFVIDLGDPSWLSKAVAFAEECTMSPYIPTAEAVDRFDQQRSVKRLIAQFYDCEG